MAEKFLFVLNGPSSNRGCEAILLSTYHLLKEVFPAAKFVNSSFRDLRLDNAEYLALPELKHVVHPETWTLPWVRWQIAKRLQGHSFNFERFLPSADFVLSLGGDNYSLDYGSAQIFFDANEVILQAGKKLVLWGCSVGPFDQDPALERYVAAQLKRLFKIVVRESRTKAYLDSLGVSDNVVLLPDPAFSLSPTPIKLSDDLEQVLSAGAIGLNLSPLLARYRAEPEQWTKEAAALVRALLEAVDKPILLIPHVMQPGNDDAAFMSRIAEQLSDQRERLHLLPAYSLSSCQLKYVISRLCLFVGARTHATIAALSTNVPTLSIGYSVKARGINEDIFGCDKWVVDHLTMNAESLVSKVCEIIQSSQDIIVDLQKINETYRINKKDISSIFIKQY